MHIREQDVPLTKALRARVEQRLGLALGRFAGKIGAVTVRFFSDGADKRCEIDVELLPPKIRVISTDADLFAAVDQASGRLPAAVDRSLERAAEWDDRGLWARASAVVGKRAPARSRSRTQGGDKQ